MREIGRRGKIVKGGSRTGRKEERRGGEEGGGDESCQSGDKRAEEGCGAAAENMKLLLHTNISH